MEFLQLLINTAALGAAYALGALGFVWVLNAPNAVNFAHGDLVMAGGFAAVALAGLLPLPGILLLPLVVVLMAGLGLVVSLVAFFPLKDRPPVSVFISTIALGIIVSNGATAIFGAEPRAAPPLFAGGAFALGGDLVVSRQAIAVMLVAVLLITGQHLLFTRTQFGRRLRATA